MDVYLLGAGASKAFITSKTDEKLPLANDFFSTFNKLDISGNGWVLIGDLINYVQEKRGTPPKTISTNHLRNWCHPQHGTPGDIRIDHIWLSCK